MSLLMMTLEAIAARLLIATMQSITAASVTTSLRSSESTSVTWVTYLLVEVGKMTLVSWSTITSVMAEALIIKIKLLVSTSTAVSSVMRVTTVASMGSNTETVVTVIAAMAILLTELSATMRAVLVTVGIAVFVMSRPPRAIRIIVWISVTSVSESRSKETSAIIIQVKLLMSATAVASSMVWVSVTTVGTDAESVIKIIASVIILLAELGVVVRAVLVSVGIAVLVVGRSSGTIRIVVVVMASIAARELDELLST